MLRKKDSKIFKKEHSGTFRNIQGPSGTFRNLQEPSGTLWNLQKPSGTFWNLLKPSENLEFQIDHRQTYLSTSRAAPLQLKIDNFMEAPRSACKLMELHAG